MMKVRQVQDLIQRNQGLSCRVKILGRDQVELADRILDMVKLELLKEWQMEVVNYFQSVLTINYFE